MGTLFRHLHGDDLFPVDEKHRKSLFVTKCSRVFMARHSATVASGNFALSFNKINACSINFSSLMPLGAELAFLPYLILTLRYFCSQFDSSLTTSWDEIINNIVERNHSLQNSYLKTMISLWNTSYWSIM